VRGRPGTAFRLTRVVGPKQHEDVSHCESFAKSSRDRCFSPIRVHSRLPRRTVAEAGDSRANRNFFCHAAQNFSEE
jgi:hypothetical protein